MRLTKQTNYAIRILMYCAANEGKLSQIPEIASAYGLSEPFLFKILKPLVTHGYVESIRGRNGGIRLKCPATSIHLSEVIRITEDNFAMADCFDTGGTDCPLVENCGLNMALREALNAFFAVLEKYTIADLIKQRPGIEALLGIDLLPDQEISARQ
ncbi:MAG: iron-responsive transcriptional regulator RirA [Rhizobiaceae bacterium]